METREELLDQFATDLLDGKLDSTCKRMEETGKAIGALLESELREEFNKAFPHHPSRHFK